MQIDYIKTHWHSFDSAVGGLPQRDLIHIQSGGRVPLVFVMTTVIKALYQTDSSCLFVDSRDDYIIFYLKTYDALVEQNTKQNEILDTKKYIEWTKKGNFRYQAKKHYDGFGLERYIVKNSNLKVICLDINFFVINEQILNEKMEKSTDNTLYFIISDLKRISIKYNISIIVINREDINANIKIEFTNYMKKVAINKVGNEKKIIKFDRLFYKVLDLERQRMLENVRKNFPDSPPFKNKYFKNPHL